MRVLMLMAGLVSAMALGSAASPHASPWPARPPADLRIEFGSGGGIVLDTLAAACGHAGGAALRVTAQGQRVYLFSPAAADIDPLYRVLEAERLDLIRAGPTMRFGGPSVSLFASWGSLTIGTRVESNEVHPLHEARWKRCVEAARRFFERQMARATGRVELRLGPGLVGRKVSISSPWHPLYDDVPTGSKTLPLQVTDGTHALHVQVDAEHAELTVTSSQIVEIDLENGALRIHLRR